MGPEQRDKAYLWDMLDAALAIQDFVRGKTPRDYTSDRMLRNAVERNIEVVGEAGRRVSDATRQAHPEIPWRSIIGQRNILAHEYDQVRHEIIWNVATRQIPDLIGALRAILPDEKENQ
jgi:uncharacterized protein with HEPN domain